MTNDTTRKMPEELPPELFGPDYCLLCWAYDGNLCSRCKRILIEGNANDQ